MENAAAAGWEPSDTIALVGVLVALISVLATVLGRAMERRANERAELRREAVAAVGPIALLLRFASPAGLTMWGLTDETGQTRLADLADRWAAAEGGLEGISIGHHDQEVRAAAKALQLTGERCVGLDIILVKDLLSKRSSLATFEEAEAGWHTALAAKDRLVALLHRPAHPGGSGQAPPDPSQHCAACGGRGLALPSLIRKTYSASARCGRRSDGGA